MSVPGDLLEALGREARARLGRGGGETRLYRGRSIEELIPRIQAELGADAIILRRREGLAGGVLGFFQHPFVEIEAMAAQPRLDVYDEEPAPAAPPPAAATPTAPVEAPPPASLPAAAAAGRYAAGALAPQQPPPAGRPEEEISSAYVTARLAALARSSRPVAAAPPPPPRSPSFDFQELLARETPRTSPAPPTPAPPPQPERRTVAPGSHSRARAGVERSLLRLGIGQELAQELIEGALAHVMPLAPRAGLAQAVRELLAQRIPVAPPLPVTGAAVAVVGAGGSGKTTCCATLLGAYRRAGALPAGCATLTRSGQGGAELQMLLSPQIVKPTPATSARALKALGATRTGGLAIVDTPDVSPSDRAGIRELGRLLAQIEPDRVVVALPATLGAAAAAQLLRALAPLKADSLAITHADETDQIGVAVEAACRFALAPEYALDRARGGGWRLRRLTPAQLAGSLLP